MDKLLYGAAYYDEYMPEERLEKDIEMMKKANINLVRIAESTWSTLEPHDDEFDFYHIDRVLQAMEKAGINVIIGTPTYAVPAWMVKKHPDIMVVTREGGRLYGARQIMDITNEHYLFYCERVIRKLMEHVRDCPAVIGYQIDNETKHFQTAGENVQKRFVEYLKDRFAGDIEAVNRAFGLNYWSNAVHSWEDFPDVRGTINGSLGGEFEKFQRELVTEFLSWQAELVREYKRPDQFITHNFDFGWKEGSYGVQPDVNHFHAAKCLDVTGCDIYHPGQSHLTGAEIAFCGDLARSLKQDNYYVLETQAQGFPHWEPYDGQLRLQAFSHLASGADMVEYWHWHSIHNSFETYWRGLLSHDFKENKTYNEAVTIGGEFQKYGRELIHLKKKNKIAFMVSNESLTALNWFPIGGGLSYNDVLRWLYDALYEMNYECDFLSPESENLSDYQVIFLPALYSVPEEALRRLKEFAGQGGCLVGTFKSCFTDENVKVFHDTQPHILHECFGVSYQHFTYPEDTYLRGKYCDEKQEAAGFMECLVKSGAGGNVETILKYDHDNWGQYDAAVKNSYGLGKAYYFGCMFGKELLKKILKDIMEEENIFPNEGSEGFPVVVRKGINEKGKEIVYYLNYSGNTQRGKCPKGKFINLFGGKPVRDEEEFEIDKWGIIILAEE